MLTCSPTKVTPRQSLDDGALEEPLIKRICLNLLALAKRAPLGKIVPSPAELVSEGMRGIVPTA
ncbi:hypothetical protein EV401DRAFT_2050543 [Pisolithus croceorrhizus]|nr:hypothetical protein EV401DRAFT_2050543 [Pisolithus croceorrhizus]